jgi:hypothetical protein
MKDFTSTKVYNLAKQVSANTKWSASYRELEQCENKLAKEINRRGSSCSSYPLDVLVGLANIAYIDGYNSAMGEQKSKIETEIKEEFKKPYLIKIADNEPILYRLTEAQVKVFEYLEVDLDFDITILNIAETKAIEID